MELVSLNIMNKLDYEGILDPDVSENIGREYYRGIIAVDEGSEPSAVMVWEYKNLEENNDTQAEICFMSSADEKAAEFLLSEFDEQASSNDVQRSFFDLCDLSEDITKCLAADGFQITEGEGRDLKLTVADLASVANSGKKAAKNIVGLNQITNLQFMQGVTNCLFHNRKGIVEDLEYLEKDWFDESISCGVITDNKVNGMLLIHRFPSGILMPVLFTAIGPDYKANLRNMIICSAQKAMAKYAEDTPVVVRRHSEAVRAITQKLWGDKTAGQTYQGSRE